MRTPIAILLALTAGVAVNSAIAQVTTKVLDQANQASSFNFGFSFFTREGNPIRWEGQTITAGITGQLTQVDLPIWRQPDFDSGIHLQILSSSLGVLGSVTVATSLIPTGSGAFPPPGADPFSLTIDLSALGINVVAGESFVIAARSTALFPLGIGGNGINWLGLAGNPYGGGHQFVQFGTTITDTSNTFPEGADLGFRTYVLARPTDATPPVLNLPASFAVDATSPAGATVNYTVTATDDSGVTPSVSCFPLSGVAFTIGMTTVNCTATDTAGNSATGSFTVTVNGPVAQLSNLAFLVASFDNPFGITNSLSAKLQSAIDSLKEGDAASACSSLNAFINEARAQSGKKLAPGEANLLIERANQIRAAQGCS